MYILFMLVHTYPLEKEEHLHEPKSKGRQKEQYGSANYATRYNIHSRMW